MLKLQGSAPSGRLFEPPGSKTGIEYEFVQDNAGIPYRRELTRGAVKLFGEFSVFRDLLILTIGVFSVHLSLSTKFGDFALQYDDCAANSWLMVFYLCVLIAVVLGSNLVRAVHDLSNLGEVVYDILLIVFGTIMAAAVSFHRWKTESGTTDVCSAANNPSAWGLYLLSDLLGIGAIFRLMLLAYLKPPCGPGAAWVVGILLLSAVFQLAVLDLLVAPELAEWWKFIEKNGTVIDADLAEVTDRLSSLESLLNETIEV